MRERWPLWLGWYTAVAIASIFVVVWIGVERLGETAWIVMSGVSVVGCWLAAGVHGSRAIAVGGGFVIDVTLALTLASVPPSDSLIDLSTLWRTLCFPGLVVASSGVAMGWFTISMRESRREWRRERGLCARCGESQPIGWRECPRCGNPSGVGGRL